MPDSAVHVRATAGVSARPIAPEKSPAWRWLAPSLSDVIFGALLLWILMFTIHSDGSVGLLQDANTGYHIRTGDFILERRAVPHSDIFSFSKPGQPWFAWEWLSAVFFAALYAAAGMKGLLIFTATVIALSILILLRHIIWRGANALVAIVVLHLVAGASSIHYLARPHVFTFLFLAISLWLIDSDRQLPSARIWMLIPIAVIWVNMHGGFVALLACLGVVAMGSALEGSWPMARRYALLAAGCLAGSAVNPYGFGVHAHVVQYLRAKWIPEIVQEFQSPRFGSAESLYFEILLFAGIACAAWLLSRKQVSPALLILAWAHAALTSMRHIPIYGFVTAPLLAREATGLWDRWLRSARPGSTRAILGALATDHRAGLRRTSIWAPALVMALALFSFGWKWPADFPEGRFPIAVAARNADLISGSRIFTTDSWADYLTFHFYPRQKIFVDGRSDFFGKEISEEYVQILKGQYGWDTLIKRYDFNTALVPPQSALASLLRVGPDWRVVDEDTQAVLFERLRRR
jgi:hypothetical protein